jgi:hypothetical protein
MSKGELLFEVQGKSVSTTIKEITPHGIRMEMNDQGQLTGKLNAGQISTINMFQKPDGNSEWEGKGLINTRDGDMVVVSSRGTGSSAGPGTATWHGEMIFMTQSPKLSWLNNSKGWVEGSADMASGTYKAKVYAKK